MLAFPWHVTLPLQDAQAEEGLKQHEAGGDYDDGEMVLQQKRLSGAPATAKKKKDQLMKKLHKKEKRKTVPDLRQQKKKPEEEEENSSNQAPSVGANCIISAKEEEN